MLDDKIQVKQRRNDKGWTQQQLADLCALNIRTVQRLEKTGVASMETVCALARVFEIEVRALLEDSNNDEVKEASTQSIKGWHIAATSGVVLTLGCWLG